MAEHQTAEDKRLAPVWQEFVQMLDVMLKVERCRSLEQLLTFKAAVHHIISDPPFVAYVDRSLDIADEDVAGHGEESVEHSGLHLARSLSAALRGAIRDLGELQGKMVTRQRKRKWVKQRRRALARALAVVGCIRRVFDLAYERRYQAQDGLMLLEKLLRIHQTDSRTKGSPRG